MKFILQRVRLNKEGYDSNGAYWGVDMPLYWAYYFDHEHNINEYIRARDRDHAKTIIKLDHPNATFYN